MVGYAPLVLAMTSGELPVAWYIQSSSAYFERWYMEKDTVRTRVMLARGDHTPMASLGVLSDVSQDGALTSPEAMEALGSICVADTVGERVELVASRGQHGRGRLGAIVRLQPRLDRVERILRSISLRSTSA